MRWAWRWCACCAPRRKPGAWARPAGYAPSAVVQPAYTPVSRQRVHGPLADLSASRWARGFTAPRAAHVPDAIQARRDGASARFGNQYNAADSQPQPRYSSSSIAVAFHLDPDTGDSERGRRCRPDAVSRAHHAGNPDSDSVASSRLHSGPSGRHAHSPHHADSLD